ncbi:MAG: hypothetical protein P8Z81_05425 [Deinococcales bacterium]
MALTVALSLVLASCGSSTTSGTGSLSLSLTGLPSGVAGHVVVTGPNAFTQTVTASATLSGVPAGIYTLAPAAVSDGTYLWDGHASSSQVDVTAGSTRSAAVTYSESSGAIGLAFSTLQPLPPGATYSATITGNGITRHVTVTPTVVGTAAVTVPNLPLGTYQVTAPNISSACVAGFDAVSFPTIATNPVVVAIIGFKTPVSITYVVSPSPLPC